MPPSNRQPTRLIRTRGIDPWLMMSFLGLLCIGVLMVYSSSIADAYAYYGSPYYFLIREVIWVAVGLLVLAASVTFDYRRWEKVALPLFGISVFLLALVMVPHVGHASHGAQRWLSFTSFITIEPSELIKLTLIVYLAAWLTSKGDRVQDFRACFVPFSLIVGMIALLIVRQPDLGTTIVVTVTAIAMFYVAGANLSHLAAVCSGAGLFAWMLSRGAGYRHDRLMAFLNPWHDPTGVGYHTIQALLALRYGGLFGTGLGNSSQKWVLPAPHTDSILAIIGEEWGLLGTLVVMFLFLIVAYRGIRVTTTAPDSFGRLLALGITCWITFQALMNFAVITSSVPFTGVPLPFISYGGTSLVFTMAALGILLNISRHTSGGALGRHNTDHGRGNGRSHLPRVINHSAPTPASAGERRVIATPVKQGYHKRGERIRPRKAAQRTGIR